MVLHQFTDFAALPALLPTVIHSILSSLCLRLHASPQPYALCLQRLLSGQVSIRQGPSLRPPKSGHGSFGRIVHLTCFHEERICVFGMQEYIRPMIGRIRLMQRTRVLRLEAATVEDVGKDTV